MLLVLWDVDHTLIDNGGLSKDTYAAAFESLTGLRAVERARTDGRTDPEIMWDLLARHGIEPRPTTLDGVTDALSTALSARVPLLRTRGCALPGAREALAAFAASPDVVQSVLTGNIRRNAVTKLAAFALDHLVDFDVGGYGSDDTVRANLVGIAQRRAGAKHVQSFDTSNTVLVGDTPRDVQAAIDGGAHVVAVASGKSSPEELRAAGAHLVLPNLRDTAMVVTAVRSLAEPHQ